MSFFNSPLAKIGIGYMTGGVGGAGLGALSATNSPAGRAAGAYNMGSNLYNSFSSPEKSSDGFGQNADWSQNSFGGQDFSDQLGSMRRRMQNYGGGGF